jgi:hypothetical protein
MKHGSRKGSRKKNACHDFYYHWSADLFQIPLIFCVDLKFGIPLAWWNGWSWQK